MNYLEFYNQPIGTIFYRGYGEEYELIKKQIMEFGELRMLLKSGPYCKPIVIFWDEYDYDEWFDTMRLRR